MKNFKYFAWFIWLGFCITFFLHNMHTTPHLELAFKSLSITMIMYVFVNYVYLSTMMRAISDRNNRTLITKTLLMSVIETYAIVIVYNMWDGFRIMHIVDWRDFLFEVFSFSVREWLGMFFIAIILNFGFYGLHFFQVTMELQKKLSESKLQTLQAQINPHFMFNVLNYINIVMGHDVSLASDLLIKYAAILRYQLDSSRKTFTSLSYEMEFLNDFIEIEQLRWQDKITVRVDWKVANPHFRLSPLVLIVPIENAFKHVSRSTTDKGFIDIQLTQQQDELCLKIHNSFDHKSITPGCKGIGLVNLQERLEMLYPESHDLQITKEAAVYACQLILKER